VRLRLPLVDAPRLEELLVDAWTMCVPKSVAADYLSRAD
jgi:hypothetical protein